LTVRLSDYMGKVVVLEWTNPDCPFVKRHYEEETMAKLNATYAERGVVWLTINSTHSVANALDELLADIKMSTPETTPYGCSVKVQKWCTSEKTLSQRGLSFVQIGLDLADDLHKAERGRRQRMVRA